MTSNCNVNLKWVASFIIVFFLNVNHVMAVEINAGDIRGSWDTTVTYGQTHRTSSVDKSIVAISNAGTVGPTGGIAIPVTGGITGTGASSNYDDGNTNFQDGLVSNTGKFVSEIDLSYKNNSGIFTRFSGFKDLSAKGNLDRGFGLTSKSERLVASNLNLLDAYAWFNLDVNNMPLDIRVGEQVISWGESTFIQNGVNVINPFDVSKLRVPGAELKESLRPIGAIFGSLGITENVSLEMYYQYDWENTELEGAGSYFSTNDFASDGGDRVQLGSGAVSDRGSFNPATLAFDPTFATVFRGGDIRPDNGGEFGAAFRLYVPELNDTEFGLYYINYHSRTPVINVTTGSATGVAAGGGAAAATAANAAVLVGALGFDPLQIASLAGLSAIDAYADTANYFVEFPKDIHLYGLSFNTTIGQSGIALQGEYTHRKDVPLQIDDAELIAAGLSPLTPVLGFTPASQLGAFATDSIIPGFIERDVSQIQMTATKVFGPVLKANQAALIAEFAVTHVHDMPNKRDLRLEAPGTFVGGNEALTLQGLQPFTESADNFADATSWGYQIRGRLDYFNVFGALNVSPRFAWKHDVSGIAPVGLSGFREDSKAITLAVSATYQNTWVADLGYTNFFGAGSYNLLNDRDFVAFSISRSF